MSSITESSQFNLDRVFAKIIEYNRKPNKPADHGLASIFADAIKQKLNHIDNPDIKNTDIIQKEISFLKNEYDTWILLDTIQKSKSPIDTCSKIKQWISGVSNYHQMDATTKKQIEEEINDEMFSIFDNMSSIFNPNQINSDNPRKRKNSAEKVDNAMEIDHSSRTSPMDDFMPKVIRRRLGDQDDEDDEDHFYEAQYICLRNGDIDEFIKNNQSDALPWRKALFTSYVQRYNKFQLNKENRLELDEQMSWQYSCKGLIHQNGLGKYGKAMYGVLSGDTQRQLEVCQSWEDIIWTYYNSQIEYGLNQTANKITVSDDLCTLDKKYKKMADQKDDHLPSQDVSHFFHLVQSYILNKQPSQLFEIINSNIKNNSNLKAMDIKNDKEIYKHIQRFLAALAIYANIHLNLPKENSNSGSLVYNYAEQYQDPATFNPTILATYASMLDDENQVALFSDFLNGFDGEKEERKILIELGKAHNLQMQSILRNTFTKFTKKPMKEVENMDPGHIDDYITGNISDQTNIPGYIIDYLHGLEWLMMDDTLYDDVIIKTNSMIRQLLGIQRVDLVEVIIKSVPTNILDVCILNTNGGFRIPPYLEEFQDHCTLVDCLDLYKTWKVLHNNYPPATTHDLHLLKQQISWKNSIIELSEKIELRFKEFLVSTWLKGKNDEVGRFKNDQLRNIYIPEIILRFHDVLYQTKDLWNGYSNKKDELIHLVASDQNGIYKDLVSTKKLGNIIQILNK
ncbi:unnamed protein product [Cunninghamella blakesleeana]